MTDFHGLHGILTVTCKQLEWHLKVTPNYTSWIWPIPSKPETKWIQTPYFESKTDLGFGLPFEHPEWHLKVMPYCIRLNEWTPSRTCSEPLKNRSKKWVKKRSKNGTQNSIKKCSKSDTKVLKVPYISFFLLFFFLWGRLDCEC